MTGEVNLQARCAYIRSQSAARFANHFGLKDNVVSVVLVRRFADDNSKKYEEKKQLDNIVIKKHNPSQYSPDFASIKAKEDRFELIGINKSVGLDWVQGSGVSFWVEAQIINDRVIGGWEAESVTVDKANPLNYSLIIRRKPDERRFT